MKLKLLFLLLFAGFSSYAQYTLIPDINFEKALIAQGIDSGVVDGKVLTSKINTLTSLDVSKSQIADLTGIQDFVVLTNLNCYNNQLTNIDVTKNIALNILDCGLNQLASLDISKNTALKYLNCTNMKKLTTLDVSKNIALLTLHCYNNQLTTLDISKNVALLDVHCTTNKLTTLDVSKNIALTTLWCSSNQLTTLDVSKNVALVDLKCDSNQLINLNLRNENNAILSNSKSSNFTNNPNLTCIQVDDVAFSNANWITLKDATASYSSNCPSLGIAETIFDKIAIYPNPTKGELHIDNVVLQKAMVYDTLGKLIKTTKLITSSNNIINLAGLPKGIYYVYLHSEGANAARKIIVE